MALILDLPDETEAALRAKASAQGASAQQYVAQILEIDLGQATVCQPSEQDHYLYGSPKRNL
ncbi:FitA-like ribbon-helix-helix domain-containing protein [Nevskia soli]|jgi:plasmid stability protein|uniref:FitA-like ribbon-helix-helix domain-containing protein n=1 Tax=Nevskia soli TaxID=418856 RepID=UPI0015D81E18|nr:hypothetical protein [Nevskia soli]